MELRQHSREPGSPFLVLGLEVGKPALARKAPGVVEHAEPLVGWSRLRRRPGPRRTASCGRVVRHRRHARSSGAQSYAWVACALVPTGCRDRESSRRAEQSPPTRLLETLQRFWRGPVPMTYVARRGPLRSAWASGGRSFHTGLPSGRLRHEQCKAEAKLGLAAG
eukprot:scaffold4569_cov117-Isochrysis_galbana.AAC.8